MAEHTYKTILEVETGKAVKTIGALRENIKALKSEIEGTELTDPKLVEQEKKLIQLQGKLKDALGMGAQAMEEQAKASQAVTNSFQHIADAGEGMHKALGDDTSALTIKDLKQSIKELNAEIDATGVNDAELAQKEKELARQKETLNNLTRNGAKGYEEARKQAEGLDNSYNGLRARLASLTKEWRSVDKVVEPEKWEQLRVQISNTRNSLKEMDAGVGNFQRNVGDYKNQMVAAFQATAGAAGGMIAPIGGVTAGLKALSATPVIGFLGLLAQVINKVIEGFESSEENVFALKKAFAVFQPIADAVTNTMQSLAKGIVKVVEWTGKMAKKLGLINKEASDEREAIAQREIELTKKRREAEMKQADEENRIAKLKEKATDKLKYTHAERIQYLKEAIALEEGISKRNVELAKEEYDILQVKATWTGNDKATNDELAQSYANVQRAETDYFNKKKELNAQVTEATNMMNAELKASGKYVKTQAEAFADAVQEIDKYIEEIGNIPDVDISVEADMELKDTDDTERTDALIGIYEKQYEEKKKWNAISDAEDEERRQKDYDLTMEFLEKKKELLMQAEAVTTDPMADLELKQAIADSELEIETAKYNEMERLRKQDEANEKAVAEAKKNIILESVATLSSVFGAMANLYEKDEKNAGKNAGKIKALRIAEATISTIQGAIDAYNSAQNLPAPANFIVGGANAGIVTATGIANINKIKATKIPNGGAGTSTSLGAIGGAIASPVGGTNTLPPAYRTLTGAKTEENLQNFGKPQKVYILSSDLEANGRKVEIRDNESTF